ARRGGRGFGRPLGRDGIIRRCGGAAVPERGQEPRLCPDRPSTGQVDRGDGGLIAPRGRRLPQAFPRRIKSIRNPLGLRPGGVACVTAHCSCKTRLVLAITAPTSSLAAPPPHT